jgi:membrane fusion protein YbhG
MRRSLLAVLVFFSAACTKEAPSDRMRASGHVEATEVRLAPDAGGRVLSLNVKIGDRVQPGQTILTLDSRDAELAMQRGKAEVAQAEAQLRLLLAGSRQEDIHQAESQVAAAKADAQATKAELDGAEQDLERFDTLLKNNSGSRKQRDDAETRRNVARDRLSASESRVQAAQGALARLQAGARREEVEAARARVAATAAQIATVEKSLHDATLVSSVTGLVTDTLVEAGETIAPRTPAIVVVDIDRAWADVFVPEPIVPSLRIGQAATIFTDAGGAGVPGTITYISPKAEFTPRNVQTADERSKLVYRIRVSADNKEGVLKQGMPVEAEFAVAPTAR